MTDGGVPPGSAAFDDPAGLVAALRAVGYLADEQTATTVFLARRLGRPLLVEGEPGVGKTSLAAALAQVLATPLIRLQCYEGIDAAQALYDWDFPRQVLHLRATEVASHGAGQGDAEHLERGLYSERFLVERPILRALRTPGAVLLIDEIDRADDEFEAFLLEVLSEYSVTIPELGTVAAADPPPLVIITSNRTRELHDALKRRCLYQWMSHPGADREREILLERIPGIDEQLADQVVQAVHRLRRLDLVKPPGIAESIDWALACRAIGANTLDGQTTALTLGAVLKYHEDQQLVAALEST